MKALLDINLQEKMQSLYISNEYFISIPKRTEGNDYWSKSKDPDGQERDRTKEEKLGLEDVQYILDFLHSYFENGRILDIGCGLGWIHKYLQGNFEKFGIEIDKYASQISGKYCNCINSSFEEEIYPQNYFDCIILNHVIEHFEDPLRVILEIKKILKPQGVLIIGTPDFDSGCARHFQGNYRLLHDKTHVSLFSCDSLHRMLRDYDFRIFKSEFPFFKTRFFNEENLTRLFDTNKVSPPFYGNFMTLFSTNQK